MSIGTPSPLAVSLTIVIVAVTLAPSVVGAVSNGYSSVLTSTPFPRAFPLTATVSQGGYLGNHSSNPFFAVLYAVTGVSASRHASQGAFFNSTPMTWFRAYGGGDSYDPTTQINYVPPPGGGTYVPQSGSLINLTAFRAWCLSRNPTCSWLAYLPAEENNTQAAVHYALWYHKVLRFGPTEWQFGNEPTAWTHYGINMTRWSTTDNSTPTGTAYAVMVRNYITAIQAIFPSDRFVGIEAACACNSTLVTQSAAVDGKRVTAMAYHGFPSATTPTSSPLNDYYASLWSSSNITNTAAHFRSIVAASCSACSNLPLELGAYQAGPSGNLSPLSTQHPGAVFLAASVVQALEANLSDLTLFNSGYMYNSTSNTILPQGMLAQRILANMTMGSDYAVHVSTGAQGIFAVETRNGSAESVLFVNANVSRSISFSLPLSVFSPGTTNSYWFWSGSATEPAAHRGVTLPTAFQLPPQSILLIGNY